MGTSPTIRLWTVSYNSAAVSFHTKKLCSRLLWTEVEILLTAKSSFVPPFADLGVTYTVYLWLAGKRVVDFLKC